MILETAESSYFLFTLTVIEPLLIKQPLYTNVLSTAKTGTNSPVNEEVST